MIARSVRRGKLEDLKIGSNQAWFVIHRGLMITTVTITIISFIIVMVSRGGWSKSAGTHAILGIITIVLAILNPIGALLRPDKFSGIVYSSEILHKYRYFLMIKHNKSKSSFLQRDSFLKWVFNFDIFYCNNFPWYGFGLIRLGSLGDTTFLISSYFHWSYWYDF